MAWADYVYVKLRILKNGNFYAEGKYKGFAVTASVLSAIVDDINGLSAGGNLLGVPAAYSTSGGNWAAYEASVIDTSPELKTLGIAQALENVGDELTFYNPEVGTRYALHLRRAADSGDVRTIETAYTHAGTKSGYTLAGAYYGTDAYGRWRTVTIGFVTQDYGAYPFLMLAAFRSDSSSADLKPWLGFTAADFRSTVQYDYFFAISNAWQPPQSTDPYHAGGDSEGQLQTGAGTGNFDDTSDVISIPSTPTLNLAACQMINVYVPSLADVQSLAQYLWTNFDLHDVNNSLSKVFTDPINAILSVHILPFTPNSSTAITVTFGGYATSVQIPPASEQFHDVDCGSLTFSEYWGNYLDYNPYTRITACLPFVGQVDLDPDEVMGKTVKIKYRVDIVTGAFVCFLYIDGEKVLGQYAGNMAQQVPVSAADFSRLNAAILNVASTAAAGFGGAVMGGFSAASAVEGGISAGMGLGQSAVDNVLNAKVRVAHSGGLSGSPGIMGIMKPYVIIHRARQSVPADANHFKGYPCNAKFNLADLEGCGFTSVRRIKLDGIKLTEGELEELRQILADGVYL